MPQLPAKQLFQLHRLQYKTSYSPQGIPNRKERLFISLTVTVHTDIAHL